MAAAANTCGETASPDPNRWDRDSVEDVEVVLPGSIWSAALVTYLMMRPGWKDAVLIFVPCLLQCVVCVAVQASFIWYIDGVVLEDSECAVADGTIDLLCVASLAIHVLGGEVCDSLAILAWLREIPTRARDETTGLVLKKEKNTIGGTEKWRPAFGISVPARVSTILFLVIGRLLVALALFAVGSKQIVHTEDVSEKILNAVAIAFVVDLDDFAYKFCMPDLVRNWLLQMPKMSSSTVEDETLRRILFQVGGCYVLPLIVAMIVFPSVYVWCAEYNSFSPFVFIAMSILVIVVLCCSGCGVVAHGKDGWHIDWAGEIRRQSNVSDIYRSSAVGPQKLGNSE